MKPLKEWPRPDAVNLKLTIYQIEQAVNAFWQATPWPFRLDEMIARNVKVGIRAAAPFLQMAWDPATPSECSAFYGDMHTSGQSNQSGAFLYGLSKLIERRNAALLPPPADPRRAKILDVLMTHTPSNRIRYEEMADRIIAALDEKE